MLKVLDKLVLVQHALIPLVQVIWEIPMEKRKHWLDASLDKVVHKFDVMLEALLVDRVIASTERDDAGPREREAI